MKKPSCCRMSFATWVSRISIGAEVDSGRRRRGKTVPHSTRSIAPTSIVIAGQSPRELAPVLWLRVRKAALRGAKIVQAASARAAREAAGDAAPVALVWDGADPAEGRGYAEAFAGVSGLATYIASEQGNARGAEAMGMLPFSGPGYAPVEAGQDGYAMLDAARTGTLSVLSIFGANPARNAIDPALAAKALEQVPFLAVSELFMTETAQRATLVLPAKGAFEKNGTTLALGGDMLPVNASLEAPESVRSDYEMLLGLADQLGISVLPSDELHRLIVGHVAKAAPDFTLGDERFSFHLDRRVAAESNGEQRPILSGGGTWEHDPTLAALRS